jgi:hypothetical protein
MVALEPGKPLLLYVVATTEVMSMVLVIERPEPRQHQALKGAPVADSGFQDPNPAGGPVDKMAFGSQILEPTLSPEPQIGSQLPEAASGPEDQGASES